MQQLAQLAHIQSGNGKALVMAALAGDDAENVVPTSGTVLLAHKDLRQFLRPDRRSRVNKGKIVFDRVTGSNKDGIVVAKHISAK